jgi:glycosyltransferase involved in cell wall biosynthesis
VNITLLDSATVPHGAAFWARTMAEQFAARGHRITLLVPPRSPLRDPPPENAALRLVPLRNNYDFGSVAALISHLWRERVDVFLFQGSRGIRLGGLAALLAGVPGVARVGIGGGLKATAYDLWLCRRAVAHFIANATAIQQELAGLPWVGPQRVTRIYNGIDLDAFRRASVQAFRRSDRLVPNPRTPERPNANLRQGLRIPSNAPVIAVVARLQAHKGHEDLFRCLPGLWAQFPALRVLVAGQGPHEAHLRRVVAGLQAEDRVRFLGHCDDVQPVLEAADLFVLPSHREGLPNAVLEAMAMDLPVVAAAADGTGEVVVDGETGLLVPPGDRAALGAAVARLLVDGALRRRLTQDARSHLEAYFSLPRAVEQVETLLWQVARAGKREAEPVLVSADQARRP